MDSSVGITKILITILFSRVALTKAQHNQLDVVSPYYGTQGSDEDVFQEPQYYTPPPHYSDLNHVYSPLAPSVQSTHEKSGAQINYVTDKVVAQHEREYRQVASEFTNDFARSAIATSPVLSAQGVYSVDFFKSAPGFPATAFEQQYDPYSFGNGQANFPGASNYQASYSTPTASIGATGRNLGFGNSVAGIGYQQPLAYSQGVLPFHQETAPAPSGYQGTAAFQGLPSSGYYQGQAVGQSGDLSYQPVQQPAAPVYNTPLPQFQPVVNTVNTAGYVPTAGNYDNTHALANSATNLGVLNRLYAYSQTTGPPASATVGTSTQGRNFRQHNQAALPQRRQLQQYDALPRYGGQQTGVRNPALRRRLMLAARRRRRGRLGALSGTSPRALGRGVGGRRPFRNQAARQRPRGRQRPMPLKRVRPFVKRQTVSVQRQDRDYEDGEENYVDPYDVTTAEDYDLGDYMDPGDEYLGNQGHGVDEGDDDDNILDVIQQGGSK